MKRVAVAAEKGSGTGRPSQSDAAFSRFLSLLGPTRKKARSGLQQWMHENWTIGLNLQATVAEEWRNRPGADWEDAPGPSATAQPPNFRMTVASKIFETLSEEERESWQKKAKEEKEKGKGKGDVENDDDENTSVPNDAVDIAA